MARRTRTLRQEPFEIGEPGEVLTIEVAYEEGGANWFHGGTSPRGYFVRVRPERLKEGLRSFTLGEGSKALIEPAKRFSDKRLEALSAGAHATRDEVIPKLIAKVTAERIEKARRNAERRAAYEAAKAAGG